MLDSKSELIEDYALTESPPLATNLRGRFAAVQTDLRSNRCDLLSVSPEPENELVLFRAAPESRSAWRQYVSPVPGKPAGDILKILAFSQGGTLYALVHFPDPLDVDCSLVRAIEWDGSGQWIEMPLDDTTRNDLERTSQMGSYQDADGNLLVYAISHNYWTPTLVVSRFDPAEGWVNAYRAPAEAPLAPLRLIAGKEAGEITVVQILTGQIRLRGAEVQNGKFVWTRL